MNELDLSIFPNVSKDDWNQLAKKQLKGQDPNTSLSWLSDSTIELGPYYDVSDIQDLKYLIDFFESTPTIIWKLYDQLHIDDEKRGNELILESLVGGCDGVILETDQSLNFPKLLADVQVDICDISIDTSHSLPSIPLGLTGFTNSRDFSNAVMVTSEQTQVDAIVYALDSLEDKTHIIRSATSDFFLEIASIRALRFLLYDVLKKSTQDVHIHTQIPTHQNENHQWFLNATSGIASVLGGTNSISFPTATGSNRISRNVGNIIREEAGIKQYEDQCGGSYFVEMLTHTLINACKAKLDRSS